MYFSVCFDDENYSFYTSHTEYSLDSVRDAALICLIFVTEPLVVRCWVLYDSCDVNDWYLRYRCWCLLVRTCHFDQLAMMSINIGLWLHLLILCRLIGPGASHHTLVHHFSQEAVTSARLNVSYILPIVYFLMHRIPCWRSMIFYFPWCILISISSFSCEL